MVRWAFRPTPFGPKGPEHLIFIHLGALLGMATAELTHALYRLIRRRGITPEEADQALSQFLAFPIQTIATPELYQRAFLFARTRGVNTYDSLYVVLSQMLDTELWTDDRRLLHTLESTAPWVRWLGDYTMG